MNAAVQIPGLNNAWTMPIKTRIDMLATGIKTPVGIKVAGADLARTGTHRLRNRSGREAVPGTSSAFAERTMGGNYIEFHIDRDEIARYGLTVGRRAGSAGSGAWRHAADHDGRRAGTLQRQSALQPRFSREPRGAARDHRADAHGRAGSARTDREH